MNKKKLIICVLGLMLVFSVLVFKTVINNSDNKEIKQLNTTKTKSSFVGDKKYAQIDLRKKTLLNSSPSVSVIPLTTYDGTQSSDKTLKDGDTIDTATIPASANVTWTLKSNGETSEDNIYVEGKVTVKGSLTIVVDEASFTVDEKHYYFRADDDLSSIFSVEAGGSLTIEGVENHNIILSGRAGYNDEDRGYKGPDSTIEDVSSSSSRPEFSLAAIKSSGKLNLNYMHIENINATSSPTGGGIYLSSSDTTTINNSVIKWIKAKTGSAMYISEYNSGDVFVSNTTIEQCAALKQTSQLGGTIKTLGATSSNLTVDNVQFRYNYSYGHGAGLYWNAANKNDTSENKKEPLLILRDSNFYKNKATKMGGAVLIESNAKLQGDCLIEGNEALLGGGIAVNGYVGSDAQSSMASNFSIDIGSGISLKDNIATSGGGLALSLGEDMKLGVGSSIELIINGALVSGNQATEGGGVYFSNNSLESNNYKVNLKMNFGNILNNVATSNGGGFYLNDVDFIMEDGLISGNSVTSSSSSNGNGGGVLSTNANFTLNGGTISENTASGNGGGFYVYSDETDAKTVNMSNGNILKNTAKNGGGFAITGANLTATMDGTNLSENSATNGGAIYINSSNFNLEKGTITKNTVTENGGAFYINDNSVVNLNDGKIDNNKAKNGGGFYQTQTTNSTITTLSGSCEVSKNTATDGNGGAVYIDGGSTFNVKAGKIAYNKAIISSDSLIPATGTLAKNSSLGVGGGIYLKKGTFSMADSNHSAGIFGNIADYAADDLYASGTNTLFDAIPVLDMALEDQYATADSWFEDYPKNEVHMSLNTSNRTQITSIGRYRDMTGFNSLVLADSVLTASQDYICITMGKGVGNLVVNINDDTVHSDHIFLYRLDSLDDVNFSMEFTVRKGRETKITDVPTGNYKLTLISNWSWRYGKNVISKIVENGESRVINPMNEFDVRIYSYQETDVTTSYFLNNKRWFSYSMLKKIPVSGVVPLVNLNSTGGA